MFRFDFSIVANYSVRHLSNELAFEQLFSSCSKIALPFDWPLHT